jgi:hypothetical protein
MQNLQNSHADPDPGLLPLELAGSDRFASSTDAPAVAARRGGLTRRDFFDAVAERLREELPAERRDFRQRANPLLLKLDYGNDRVHYEVWCDGERKTIELGLHFEDGPVSTTAYLAYFDGLIVELKHDLGPELELERWTASWGHLYEHWPLTMLTEGLAARVAARLARLIARLQPLVEAAGIPPERSALAPEDRERRGPWRKWRR